MRPEAMVVGCELKAYSSGDERQILELFSVTFQQSLSEASWRWRFVDSPAGPAVISLAFAGERLASHYAVTTSRFVVDGLPCVMGLSGATMTHPDFRGLGLFPTLGEHCYAQMGARGMRAVFGFPNDNSHRGFARNLGWTDIYEIPTLRLRLGQQRGRIAPVSLRPLDQPGEEIDALWKRCRTRYSIAQQRDSAYLTWRYRAHPDASYRLFVAPGESGKVEGFVVVKPYGEELHIVDMLADSAELDAALVAAVVRLAEQEGTAAVSLWLSVHHPAHAALELMGFRNEERVTYFGVRPMEPVEETLFSDYRQWYLMMGDSDVY